MRIEERIALTQPDLPEPVVPATRMCGILARSAETALPSIPLPSQAIKGELALGGSRVDVAEADDLAAGVGHLDPHRLLAGDRGQDADVGRRQRVGEVVGQLGDLLDLGAGRQAQLEAGDVRPADDADDPRLDAEVPERLHQLAADASWSRVSGPESACPSAAPWVRACVIELLRGGDAALLAHRRLPHALLPARPRSAPRGPEPGRRPGCPRRIRPLVPRRPRRRWPDPPARFRAPARPLPRVHRSPR